MQFTAGVCMTGPSPTKRSRSTSRPLTSSSHSILTLSFLIQKARFPDRSVTAKAHAAKTRIAAGTWSKSEDKSCSHTRGERKKKGLTLMAAPSAEARAKATTLPRRAAVDPTAGAAEQESAKFIVSERVDRGKERERERKGRTARKGKVNSQHYYFFEEDEKDKQAPQTSRLHSLSSSSSSFY